ncbi:MAG: hypothetical protein ABXS93_03365 [Sulfurimonas sp.]
MKKEYKESFIGKTFTTVIVAPLFVSLVLSVWMWGVFSISYLKSEIMQYKFSAFIYKGVYDALLPYGDSALLDPTFIAITLTLTILIGLIGIALALFSLLVKSIYKLFFVSKEKEEVSSEDITEKN